MAQRRRVKPVGIVKLGSSGRRSVFGHTGRTSLRRVEIRAVANSSSTAAKGEETLADLPEGDCGLCELKPPGA